MRHAPENIGALADAMHDIANVANACDESFWRGTPEYGFAAYASEKGHLYFVVARGKGESFSNSGSVQFKPLMRLPDGTKLLLVGGIAHTHTFGAPVPSDNDFNVISSFHGRIFKQQYALLSVPGAGSTERMSILFDGEGRMIKLNEQLMKLPVSAFFDYDFGA